MKYYRALVTDNETGKKVCLDSTSYTSKDKFARDIRGNGYSVSIKNIVLITDPLEQREDAFKLGTIRNE